MAHKNRRRLERIQARFPTSAWRPMPPSPMDEPNDEGAETSVPSVVAGQLNLRLEEADQIPWDRPADYEQPTDSAGNYEQPTDSAPGAEPEWDRPNAGRPEKAAVAAGRVQTAWQTSGTAGDPDDAYAPVLEDVAPVVARAWSDMADMAGADPPWQDAPIRSQWHPRPVEPSELSGRGLGPTPPESLFASRPSIWPEYDEPAPSGGVWDPPAREATANSNPESSGALRHVDSTSLSPSVDAGSRSTTIENELAQSMPRGAADAGAPPPLVLRIEVAIVGDAARYISPGDVQVSVQEWSGAGPGSTEETPWAAEPQATDSSGPATPWVATADEYPSHQEASWDTAPELDNSLAVLKQTPAPPSYLSRGPDVATTPSFGLSVEAQPSHGPLFAEEASDAVAPARNEAPLRRRSAAVRIVVWTLAIGVIVIVLVAVFLRLMTGVL